MVLLGTAMVFVFLLGVAGVRAVTGGSIGLARGMAGVLAVTAIVGIAGGIGLLLGAMILRAACWLLNLLAGNEEQSLVPEPGLGQGMDIAAVATAVNFFIGILAGLMLVGASQADLFAVQILLLPVSFLVFATVATAMLPAKSFVRGLLVALAYNLIAAFLAAAIVAAITLVAHAVA